MLHVQSHRHQSVVRCAGVQGCCSCVTVMMLLGTLSCIHAESESEKEDDFPTDDPHRDPSICEVCKYLANELKERLDETGKTKEVLETGYGLDQKKKKKEYRKSELRLIEAVNDPHVCNKILEYNIHAERKGSLRFDKGRSQTMETLHGLVDKGVKVDLGIPFEMWDSPQAAVTEMQRKCFTIVEEYEDDIEDWYWNHQEEDLVQFLCEKQVLTGKDKECLNEVWTGEKREKEEEDEKKKGEASSKPPKAKAKKDKGKQKGDDGTGESQAVDKDEL